MTLTEVNSISWLAVWDRLTSRERAVIQLRMQGKTLAQVGKHFGVGRERIRQNEAKARYKWVSFMKRA